MDISYIPMARGFVYLAAVVDGSAGGSWRGGFRSTLEVDFCLEAVEEALARHGKPEIYTPIRYQFTSIVFTGLLLKTASLSAWIAAVRGGTTYLSRGYRSVKYEEVYLPAYDTVAKARSLIGRYLKFFNSKRPHSSLAARTPDHAYFTRMPTVAAAA